MAAGPGRSATAVARRYAPFVAIVAVQLLLLAFTPGGHSTSETVIGAAADAGTGGGTNSGDALGTGGGGGSALTSGTTPGAGSAVPSRSPAPAAARGSGDQAGRAALEGTSAAAGTAGQRLDGLGRPLDGDRSRCAAGGVVQEAVTSLPMPCMPAFAGDNGGNTAPGVTATTISVVLYIPDFGPTVDAALNRAGLYPSQQEWHDALSVFLGFVNKHYELYGRKLVGQEHYVTCSDDPCYRADAKAVVATLHPFAVIGADESGSTIPESAVDQFTQLGVVTRGAPALSDEWFKAHAPYAWGVSAQGYRVADMLADYYCKKMWGKNATLAGDPTLQIKKRKLGIITSDEPATLDVWRRFRQQVTGGMCGTVSDGTTLYTVPADTAEAQNQGPTLMTRLKNDGITTVAGLTPLGTDADKQQYYPENLSASQVWDDTDSTGRLEGATGSPTQLSHTFGIGWWPAAEPVQQMDYYKVSQEMAPGSDLPFPVEFAWKGVSLIGRLIQWAGPHLTARAIEAGARVSPQLGGWSNAAPWPGWKCCDPFEPEWKLASGPGSYTAVADAREIYWDSKAISKQDNEPGAWICVDNCRRYQVGQWPHGDPEKGTAG